MYKQYNVSMVGMFDKCLYFSVIKLSRSVNAIWESAYRSFGLSPSQAYLLQFILSEPGETPKNLAKKMELNLSTVSRLLDGLAKKSLIKRIKESSDKRECCIYPTPEAKKIKGDIEKTTKELAQKVKKIIGKEHTTPSIDIINNLNTKVKNYLDKEIL